MPWGHRTTPLTPTGDRRSGVRAIFLCAIPFPLSTRLSSGHGVASLLRAWTSPLRIRSLANGATSDSQAPVPISTPPPPPPCWPPPPAPHSRRWNPALYRGDPAFVASAQAVLSTCQVIPEDCANVQHSMNASQAGRMDLSSKLSPCLHSSMFYCRLSG